MNKYRVKSLSVSGRGNKIHRLKDEVRESDFPAGHAKKLHKEGHLELIGGKAAAPTKDAPKAEGDDLTRINGIGKKTAESLDAAGIGTFKALAELSDEDLANLENTDASLASKVQDQDWRAAAKELL